MSQLGSLLEAEDEWIVHFVTVPEEYSSSIHEHVKENISENAAEQIALILIDSVKLYVDTKCGYINSPVEGKYIRHVLETPRTIKHISGMKSNKKSD